MALFPRPRMLSSSVSRSLASLHHAHRCDHTQNRSVSARHGVPLHQVGSNPSVLLAPCHRLQSELSRQRQQQYGSWASKAFHSRASQHARPPSQPEETKQGIKAQVPKPVANIRERAVGYLRESLMLSYSALFDNVIFRIFEWLQLDRMLKWVTPYLENGYAALFGKWYILANGQRRSISLVNHTVFDFSIPEQYKAADFPFADVKGSSPTVSASHNSPAGCTFDLPSLYRAHMLSLCMKLVYEKHEVIDDIASRLLDCSLQGYFLTSDKQTKKKRQEAKADTATKPPSKAAFVPRTLAIVLAFPQALVVVFRGTEPTNLINMRSSGKISMSHPEGMGGVHDGFWTGLMYESEEDGSASLFDRLVATLQEGDQKLDIILTGHSLGGALAAVFAQALHARGYTELAKRVKGVHTFGGPRIGDATFCSHLSQNYPDATFRYVHGADIIPKVPPRFLLYEHFPTEIYLSSFGQLVLNAEDIEKWHRREAWGYLPIQLYKTVGNLITLKESPVRTLYRIALLLSVPGLSDHFPVDYERLLRDQVTNSAAAHAPLIWTKQSSGGQLSRVQDIITSMK